MAANDWQVTSDALSLASVKRGATTGIARPNGGGAFVFGFASQDSTPGVVALRSALAGFNPMPKGGAINAAMKRGAGGGPTGFSPFVFIGLAAADDSSQLAYMLGLSDANPSRLVLRKGVLADGIPDAPVGEQGVLARSSATFGQDTWVQLRLEVVAAPHGDAVVNCYASDLSANPVSAPVWTAIPGIDRFIDDALAVNTGSAPITSGRIGFGFQTSQAQRRVFFDAVQTVAQN